MTEEQQPTTSSRRDLIKKGAVAGGVVWAAPLVSSVVAGPAGALETIPCNPETDVTQIDLTLVGPAPSPQENTHTIFQISYVGTSSCEGIQSCGPPVTTPTYSAAGRGSAVVNVSQVSVPNVNANTNVTVTVTQFVACTDDTEASCGGAQVFAFTNGSQPPTPGAPTPPTFVKSGALINQGCPE